MKHVVEPTEKSETGYRRLWEQMIDDSDKYTQAEIDALSFERLGAINATRMRYGREQLSRSSEEERLEAARNLESKPRKPERLMFPKDRADPKKINPQHYHASGLQAVDVMEAFFKDDLHMAQAFKYMARAGKKETSPYEEDVEKAIWWLKRSLDFRTGD